MHLSAQGDDLRTRFWSAGQDCLTNSSLKHALEYQIIWENNWKKESSCDKVSITCHMFDAFQFFQPELFSAINFKVIVYEILLKILE